MSLKQNTDAASGLFLKTAPTSDGDQDSNFLTNIDFSQIDEMDPNLFDGHKVIFDNDLEFEVRLLEENGKI